ncbi:MAG: UDP-N-acetylglucosamine diphosphorylase/glucosamine-1-phosphate N-acetyltransferase [Deltaproteobacteria bacterium GWB2_55_19]|nr:MAG: UDP-N-acetylglucosamine diphosphorylase/glucosamine-1-phosphate N-acetyltransferase [Deltaproteobacteria bacterium GWB2_55_19]HAO94185.1 bifunctional UDP-N-acetylglucosamine diphosphorylase/glucosamine-1-phosphate N-acetyltransferase GlmU [Deltaproteobacteria bacterium]
MKNLAVIVLAAGKGTRMKSTRPKVLHEVAGKPMLFYPLAIMEELKAGRVAIVIGHGADDVKAAFPSKKIGFILQKEQLGTGHAVATALKSLSGFSGDVLVLSGDVPLITKETVSAFLKLHRAGGRNRPAISLITMALDAPKGYGRVVRDEERAVVRIVEDKDCTPVERHINEVNSGIYIFRSDFLFTAIKKIGRDNAQGEYYLPDLIALAIAKGLKVKALTLSEPEEVMGINNRVELARAASVMRLRINESLMMGGVTIIDPDRTYIDYGVKIGADTVVYPGAHIKGGSIIGESVVIEEGARIMDSRIGAGTAIKGYSIVEDSVVGENVQIGPFGRLRPGNVIGDKARIGNFVEVKKSRIGKGSKINHLSYIGDAVIGESVNIGAGTITCNYDGVHKHRTTIEDNAFIGSDSQLVAPVTIGRGAYVGSGTTVTKDVPPDALVVTRAKERVIEGWAKKKRAEKKG